MRKLRISFLAVVLLAGSVSVSTADSKGTPNSKAIGYWTADRMANAIPRDFQFEPGAKSAKLVPTARGPKGGSTSSSASGASWTKNDSVSDRTGKVFFTMGTTNYVCSGSVVSDADSNRSLVLTAGHCVYDNATQSFATNFIFAPNYDFAPTSDCSTMKFGCWVANALVAHSGFTSQTAFTTQATNYDWAFAVMGLGGNGGTQLDVTVGSYPLVVPGFAKGSTANSFGYPAATPYNGTDLVYCANPVFEDTSALNSTWGLSCNMTGGASGGPWMSNFTTASIGLSSVNSYKYSRDKNSMYGPKFNSFTSTTYSVALTANSNTQVP